MAFTIHKYALPNRINELPLGANATPLHVDYQGAIVCLWALVEVPKLVEPRKFFVAVTGEPSWPETPLIHIGSCQREDVKEVVHVFEVKS